NRSFNAIFSFHRFSQIIHLQEKGSCTSFKRRDKIMDSTKILFYKTFDKQHFSEIQPEAGHIPERRGQMAKKNKPQNRISQRLIPQKEYLLLEDFAGIEIESGENIKPIDQVN